MYHISALYLYTNILVSKSAKNRNVNGTCMHPVCVEDPREPFCKTDIIARVLYTKNKNTDSEELRW